ncbi:sugar transferase [Streptomyces paradoxus]|uniref:Exopolysaccharide biosynthesis polyprenyl glycosylphosphotransferase n=1 Tax=Streptomyces paradoxus TaxID=66375 RepID=A0A7W9T7J7_9ACTN|nr:sugar transferase [Streptomyces paradoxus]MBB6074372.1 exopolysaccharide biosynthesis polyprenyl glycosylphosphotransferase [Streptomyces paradoxus]
MPMTTIHERRRPTRKRHLPSVRFAGGEAQGSRRGGTALPGLLAADATAAAAASLITVLLYGRWIVPLAVPAVWIMCLGVQQAYERGCRRTGAEERGRVLRAAGLAVGGAVAIWWFTSFDEVLREGLCAVVVAAALTIAFRRARRRRHRYVQRILVVGPARSSAELISKIRRANGCGLLLVGACLTDPAHAGEVTARGVPVLGGAGDTGHAVHQSGPDAVVVLPCPELDAGRLRELSWQLQGEGVELMLAPVLGDVAAARIGVQMAAGMPLLRLRAPDLSSLTRIPKTVADRLLAVLALLILSPLMLFIALVVRLDSPGPILFRQRRLGYGGRAFTVLKFRSMHQGAEKRKAELAHLNQNHEGLLFKIADDPRVTRSGSFLRRYSLDELPQLFHVAAGKMSLVGPRPLSAQASAYTEEMKRRLLVKPGLTGLWQISGRSDLSWQESLHLDLSYVENWSLGLDLKILLRTASVVVRGTGAY